MDAVQILRGDLWILHAVLAVYPWIAVAFRTGLREIQFEDWRLGVLHRDHVVRAMAIRASGGRRGAHRLAHTVDAGGVFFYGTGMVGFRFVTGGALRFGQFAFVNQFLDALVAIDAIQLPVDRLQKRVGGENGHGHGFSLDLPTVGWIGVAVQAVRIGEFLSGRQTKPDEKQADQE